MRRPLATASSHILRENHSEGIEERIVRSLSARPSSSISEIAKELSVNRSTASKYLQVLKAKRAARFRQIGPVKLWSLEES